MTTDTLNPEVPHYKHFKIQPIDYITENGMDFLEGNIIKYVSRYKHKGGVEDLRKAKNYLEWLIDREATEEGKISKKEVNFITDKLLEMATVEYKAGYEKHQKFAEFGKYVFENSDLCGEKQGKEFINYLKFRQTTNIRYLESLIGEIQHLLDRQVVVG